MGRQNDERARTAYYFLLASFVSLLPLHDPIFCRSIVERRQKTFVIFSLPPPSPSSIKQYSIHPTFQIFYNDCMFLCTRCPISNSVSISPTRRTVAIPGPQCNFGSITLFGFDIFPIVFYFPGRHTHGLTTDGQ